MSDGSPTNKRSSTSTTTKPKPISDDIISSAKGTENGIPSTSRRRKTTVDCHSNSSKNEGSRDGRPCWWQQKLVPIIVGTTAVAIISTVFMHISRRKSRV